MTTRPRFFSCILAIFALFVLSQSASADLTITITDDGNGGANIEFLGSGTLIAGGAFEYGSAAIDFIPGFGLANDMFSSSPAIAGGNLIDMTASAGSPFFGTVDRIVFADPGWAVGGDLTTANGLVFSLPNFDSSVLVDGTYNLDRVGDADVGDVILIVAPVSIPEPSSGLLIVASALGLAFRRRRS